LTASATAENGRLAQGLGYLHCGKTEEKENSGTVERMARSSRDLLQYWPSVSRGSGSNPAQSA